MKILIFQEVDDTVNSIERCVGCGQGDRWSAGDDGLRRITCLGERATRSIAINEQAEPSRAAIYEDVLDAPEHMVAEIARGALHLHPWPAPRHARASSSLGGALQDPLDRQIGGPGRWWILDETDLHPSEDVLVADIGGWRRERMSTLPDKAYFGLAPDWVREIVAPGTRQLDLTEKRDTYGANGFACLRMTDPIARTLDAFATKDGHWILIAAFRENAEVRVPPSEAIAFPLARLWAE